MSSFTVKKIVVFSGDGVGPEVTAEALKILDVVQKARPSITFDIQHKLIGGSAIDATGNPLPDDSLAAAKSADAVLFGAVGGPKWGTRKVRPEMGILKLRKEMDAFGNLRPCTFVSESLLPLSPLKSDIAKGTNFVVVRELCGGIYFGDRKEDDGSGHAEDVMPYSRAEIERITRLAGYLALQSDPPLPIFSLDKANVLATSRLWRNVVSAVISNEFPQISLVHLLIDTAAMQVVKSPTSLNGIILTENLFGDIITDEASIIPGSLGLMPSASLCSIPSPDKGANGIYEPIHGSAPDIAGQGIVNPVAAILSTAMLLKYSLNMDPESRAVEAAVKDVLDLGLRTKDLGGSLSTVEMGDAIATALEKILRALA